MGIYPLKWPDSSSLGCNRDCSAFLCRRTSAARRPEKMLRSTGRETLFFGSRRARHVRMRGSMRGAQAADDSARTSFHGEKVCENTLLTRLHMLKRKGEMAACLMFTLNYSILVYSPIWSLQREETIQTIQTLLPITTQARSALNQAASQERCVLSV